MSDRFQRYIAFVKRKRKHLLIALLMVNLIAFLGLMKIHISSDFNVFMPKHSQANEIYQKMTQEFGSTDQIVVMVEFKDNAFSVNGIRKLFAISDALRSVPGVKSVVPPVPEKLPVGFQLVSMKDITSENVEKVLQFASETPEMINIRQYDGKYYAMFIVNSDSNSRDMLKNVERALKEYTFYISGNSYLEAKIFDYILMIVFTLPPMAFVLILIVFRWQIGSIKATILCVFPAGIAALWTMGMLGWIGKELSLVTVLVPIFTIVMGSADGLHFVSHFLENKASGHSNSDSLAITLSSVGKAMILTTLTTMAGFISLSTINSQSMVQMGIFASVGIGLAAVATWFVLPLILVNFSNPAAKSKAFRIPAFFERFSDRKALLIALAIVIGFTPGLFLLRSDFNMMEIYKSYTKVRRSIQMIQDVFGSALPVFLVYSGNDLYGADSANHILELQRRIVDIDGVEKTMSMYDIIVAMNKRLYGEKGYPELPLRLLLIKRILPKEMLSNFVDVQGKSARSMIFLSNLDSFTLEQLTTVVESSQSKAFTELYISGIPFIMKEMNDSIIPQQLRSVLVALVCVFLLLVLSQRNFITPLLAVIPVAITLITLFGFMGYFNMDLNVVTVTMASIVIGVGIDYSIHFSELYRYYSKGGNKKQALHKAFISSSKPIIANAFGLSVGLTAMFLSPLTIHSYLASIMWVTMLTSCFISLTLLPFLIAKIRRI